MDSVDAEVGDDAVGSVIIVGEGTVVVIVDVVVINIANTDHGEKKDVTNSNNTIVTKMRIR